MSGVSGVYTNGHRPAADQLRARLDEPETVAALNTLLDHAELLAFTATALDGFIRRGDRIAENIAEGVADLRHAAGNANSSEVGAFVERLPRLASGAVQASAITDTAEFQQLATALSKPETLAALAQLIPLLPRLVSAAPQLIDVAQRLQPVVSSPEFDALLKSGVFHTDTVKLVGKAGDAFADSYADVQRSNKFFGPLGVLRALFDTHVQRTLTLALYFCKRLGQALFR